jgi:hypothetical protein
VRFWGCERRFAPLASRILRDRPAGVRDMWAPIAVLQDLGGASVPAARTPRDGRGRPPSGRRGAAWRCPGDSTVRAGESFGETSVSPETYGAAPRSSRSEASATKDETRRVRRHPRSFVPGRDETRRVRRHPGSIVRGRDETRRVRRHPGSIVPGRDETRRVRRHPGSFARWTTHTNRRMPCPRGRGAPSRADRSKGVIGFGRWLPSVPTDRLPAPSLLGSCLPNSTANSGGTGVPTDLPPEFDRELGRDGRPHRLASRIRPRTREGRASPPTCLPNSTANSGGRRPSTSALLSGTTTRGQGDPAAESSPARCVSPACGVPLGSGSGGGRARGNPGERRGPGGLGATTAPKGPRGAAPRPVGWKAAVRGRHAASAPREPRPCRGPGRRRRAPPKGRPR